MSHSTPPEPLLGSAWLLAQSPSSSSSSSPAPNRTEITPSTCLSFTHFKTLLDSSRRVSDDAITTRLNRASALSGSAVQGRGGVMGPAECEGVWRELCARWDERRKAIEFCDGVVEGERERLGRGKGEEVGEEKRLSADWKERGRGVVDELEFKRTRLSTESSIERILRHRTLSLFFSRCPSFHPSADVPAEPPLPRVKGDEEEERERERRRGRDERGRVRWT
ncbi:Caffeine-induced death protein 2-domain containing protein [Rhodotorula toruloides]|uniref:Caffeine-induced death protein 2-domain containing protein n=1 Tax=Rhodotorula toruloides TaxID=5286 RepID=A0A2S9ZWH2_RHOTO|nr:Caffeine-induced death protein 2-domain containing protein [Rhodotorula toruloides]